ncbi:response regulator [Marinibacterium sp. SX1]|uniref:response regulator n=1 Tax=Marinibacterium sp. SX1 TaxID=3388424 RepID=UPI003D184A29
MARILLLEDDEEFAELLKMDLELSDHEVIITDSGSKALDHLTNGHFDLLIADIYIWKGGRVQNDGGLLLAGRLRRLRITDKSDRRGRIPIIVISGAINRPGQANILNVASSVGADAVLAKPFSSDDMHDAVTRMLIDHPV